ncbi:MAG: beta-ketoacyl-[acyl-carrier-protein] synthase family protein [Polyangiaceae bacterium]|nr:beta-ketoacyl-[acyl-carrier-protein] synthase family protein [Polyangiaceae bacterium]
MIAVTGLGAITALGGSATETWEHLLRGDRGFREVSLFSTKGYRSQIAGEVVSMDRVGAGGDVSRTSELGLLAAREALASAGLVRDVARTDAPWGILRVGLVMGGSTAGMLETESILSVLLRPEGTVDPAAREQALGRMLSHPLSAPTDRLARELGPFARVRSLSSACSSGSNAIIVGAAWLESDLVDAVVCGAADALCQVTLGGFNALGALDPNGARPFDRNRKGLTLGEGAGFVVLEDVEAARARGAHVICTLRGWASRSEAHHITNPEASGEAPARAMGAALARAGLAAADVDYVNAHGTGTPLNDPMETAALARVFGEDLSRVPVSSCKGQIGHTLAAAGAIEATITAMSIDRGRIPPTGGLVDPDPACKLHHVHTAYKREIRAALSSSFGFGGMDSVLLFGGAPADNGHAKLRRTNRRVVVTGVATLTPAGLLDGVDVSKLPSLPSCGEAIGADALLGLDVNRARRLDRTSRIATVVAEKALAGIVASDVGIILGSAFGAIDATSAFMRRLAEKGPRFASPADFPSLVPSSPAGHVSIYLGLKGPAMVVADLATSGECAVTQGFELVRAGEMDCAVAVAVEERSAIVEEVLSVLFRAPTSSGATAMARREGAAAVALSSEEAARARGLPILAEIADVIAWTSDTDPLANLAPEHGGVVVLGAPNAAVDEYVARSSWADCPRIACSDHAGTHEAVGGIAVAVAAAIIARGDAASALCVGSARGSGYALLLRDLSR